MEPLQLAFVLALVLLGATLVSAELGLSIAIVEIAAGVAVGNLFSLHSQPWLDFLAAFGSVVLTFLAGAEVDPGLMRERLKESLLIGGFSFLVPFVAATATAFWALRWSEQASLITGVALSTTSLAVVYAVLLETGLARTTLGKIIMASTFITDFGTALALSILFIHPTLWLPVFGLVSVGVIVAMVRLQPWFFRRYGNRLTEPEIKATFAALLTLMFFAGLADSHAVLPAFLVGLAVAKVFHQHPEVRRRMQVVAFAFLTPFFFVKSGMNVSVVEVSANLGILGLLFAIKMAAKLVGVYPTAQAFLRPNAVYTTLLMSTGLTFGTISSLYGLDAGIIDRSQFSLLVTTVILTAIVPTVIAQRFFPPAAESVPDRSFLALPATASGED